MKTYLLLIILSVILGSCGNHESNNQEKFHDVDGKFKVLFPVEPKLNIHEGYTPKYGNTKLYRFISEPLKDANTKYEVGYIDYPSSFIDTLTIEEIYSLFDGSQKSSFNNSDNKLLSIFNIEILGHPGREYRWQNQVTGELSRIRFYLVRNRNYILIINTDKDNSFNNAINAFFDSFELIEQEQNLDKTRKQSNYNSYEISFPNSVNKERSLEIPTDYGNAKLNMKAFQPKIENDKNLIYSINEMSFLTDITKIDTFNIDDFFNTSIETGLIQRQSELIYQKKINHNSISGIEVKESFKDGEIIVKYRGFLCKGKYYEAMVMTRPENDENTEMNKFLNSLNIIK